MNRPKKKLGQHFLVSEYYAEKIADSVPAGRDDNVLEIGAGKGNLSLFLQKRFPGFHCVEIDSSLAEDLRNNLEEGEWTLHIENIMKFDFGRAGFPLHVVGNLPYNIGAHIIKKTLLYSPDVVSATFLVQRDVAERIVSDPDSRRYGFLSVFCGFFGKPRLLFHIPPGAFYPKPEVESSVFQILTDPDIDSILDKNLREIFFAFVSRGFNARRKTLAKNLGKKENKEMYRKVMRELDINPMARPENLNNKDWLKLFKRSCL